MNQSTSYVPNEDIPVRIDDTHNVNAEHKDVEANTGYDPNCRVRIDSDENETEPSDEDIWYATVRMMMIEKSQLSMILECGLVTFHLITTIKQT